jgi:hypothetical protein
MKVSKQYIPYQRQALSKDWLQRSVQSHRIRLKLRDCAVEGFGAPILIRFPNKALPSDLRTASFEQKSGMG